jgi:catechol 2,3-dioxygenase
MVTRAPIDPRLKIGSVRLAVADLARSLAFYGEVLGLALVGRNERSALLGASEERPALALEELDHPSVASPHDTGLFHIAWLHPTRAALAATVRRVLAHGWSISGASDHGVSEALYLTDPDGLGVEIYADRPRERWGTGAGGHGVKMFTAPLDAEDLLAQEPATTPAIAPETVIGHVHLKVGDVARAASFYHDVLGFSQQAQMPSAAFLAAGGYHHHIGLNSWQSRGAHAAPASAPGLRLVDFTLHDSAALGELERRIEDVAGAGALGLAVEPGRLSLGDPDGNAIAFSAAA